MAFKMRKVVIIGAGHVGTMCGLSLMYRGEADELVYIDIDKEKAYSQALDLDDAVSFLPRQITVRTGDYEDVEDADIIVMAAGVSRLPGQTRLDMLDDSIRIMKEVTGHLKDKKIPGILISISNPADIVADYLRKQLHLPKNRCFSTGTSLDSCRLRRILSQKMHLDRNSIQAFVMGEHGDSQMIPFSAVHIAGKPLSQWMEDEPELYGSLDLTQIEKETANAGHEVIEGKGSTEFGIGIALSEIVRSIFHDSKKVLPASPLLEGEYGQQGIHAGVPCIIGKNGVEKVIEIPLSDQEQEKFNHSCEVIRTFIQNL
ncbi:L-lactate dehydrogenase [Anaerostipes sp.]|uniref:L-lactate dehydrogenase n=1 Tax=Anaerostipes sp. TaxID=1872530 RepID=UPI0025BEB2FE|nr:L-lactate dehydrogenase [Anaerostipes sp.]MBS7007767.1 L-lactate dehydrogenase [Anaerostipes sp.]